MTTVTLSTLKARLSGYMRLVKSGEELEVRERGVPIAKVVAIKLQPALEIQRPLKNPKGLAVVRFSSPPDKTFDIVQLLIEERRSR